jgi:hypothetical protein
MWELVSFQPGQRSASQGAPEREKSQSSESGRKVLGYFQKLFAMCDALVSS